MKLLKPSALLLAWVCVLLSPGALAEPVLAHVYPIKDVHDIRVNGGAKVEIRQGKTESLRAEAAQSVLDRVYVDLSNGRLKLGVKSGERGFFNWFSFSNDNVKFIIEVKDLSRLELSGASSAVIDDLRLNELEFYLNGASRATVGRLETTKLKVDLSGAGHVNIKQLNSKRFEAEISGASNMEVKSGAVDEARVSASGASKYYGHGLEGGTVKAHVNGASRVEVHARNTLDVHASGASHVTYYGNPAVSQSSSGASSIKRL